MNKKTVLLLTLIMSFMLACNSKVPFGPVEIQFPPVPYTIVGSSTTTLPSGVQVSVTGDQTFDFFVNSPNFTVGNNFSLDESLNFSVTSPNDSYSCTISPTSLVVTSNANIEITCDQLLQGIYGNVIAYETREPAGTLDVSLYLDDISQFTLVETVTSDSFGNFVFPLDTAGDYSVMVVAEDYVPNGKLVSVTDLTAIPRADLSILQLVSGNTIDVDSGSNLNDQIGTSIVEVAANSLETATNLVAIGSVSSQYRIIDASADSSILPGEYISFDPVSFERGYIETFGADFVRFKDSAIDNLDIINGLASTIRIPIAQNINSIPNTTPLFYFDVTSSLWVQDGSATRVSLNDEDYYEASVSNHRVWSAGEVISTVLINGCVNDFDGQPIANATVISKGSNYISSSRVTTNSSGQFSIPVKESSEVFVFATSGAQSNTVTQQTSNTDITLTECLVIGSNSATMNLTWGENPRDLDSHWVGPADSNASSVFHIDFTNKTQTVGNVAIELDVDDTSKFGPEIVTMPDFPFAGTYRYAVHHFSGSSNIAASGTRVELNLNGRIQAFTPSSTVDTSGTTDTWVVFEITVDSEGKTIVSEINNYISLGSLENGINSVSSNSNKLSETITEDIRSRIKW